MQRVAVSMFTTRRKAMTVTNQLSHAADKKYDIRLVGKSTAAQRDVGYFGLLIPLSFRVWF
jgi:hypothetical protein